MASHGFRRTEEEIRADQQAAARDERIKDNELGLAGSPTLRLASNPPVNPSGPLLQPAATPRIPQDVPFDQAFGNPNTGQLPSPVGTNVGDIHPEDLFASGGPKPIQETQRGSIGIGTAVEFVRTLNGKTTGTQRANPVKLNPFQKIMLGISDVIAVSEGRQMPSTTLKNQIDRADLLEMQFNRQQTVTGMQFLKDMVGLGKGLKQEDRIEMMTTQVAAMEKMLPGSGAMGLVISSNQTESDALELYLNQQDENLRGTDVDRVFTFAAALAFANPTAARAIITTALENGVATQTIDAVTPTILRAMLPAQIAAGRELGGEDAEFWNKVASGAEITPEEYVVRHSRLPEKLKMDPSYLESFVRNPARSLAVIPGISTAAFVEQQRKAEIDGEFSDPITMVNTLSKDPNNPEMRTGPKHGKMIRELGPHWAVANQLDKDALFGVGSTDGGLFGELSPRIKSDEQENIMELRVTANELVGIDELYSPDLLTAGARITNAFASFKSFMTGELSKEQQEFKIAYIGLRTRTITSLTNTLNRLSGAAVSPQEFLRIAQTRPEPGDNPADFKAKLDTAIGLTMFAIARAHAWEMANDDSLKFAMNLTREGVRSMIMFKSRDLQARARDANSNASEAQINAAVQRDLAAAFGIRPQDIDPILQLNRDMTFAGDPTASPQEREKIK